ncbi:MAG: RNA polymerase factor sigma-54 [Candidatus Cloacimonadales bacterium]|jgi:RNA polymerase sigma-54 factor|nr:RNA polymerase factor sigma-54 [Candidatus Cloacimonadota bacterium]MDD2649647.1 RNA polymerase factor sigma-54 [Candidatus Cloacimonadota bacterium]MDX9977471.1 RNA polymerase factor sigma-54 [Candidatus Cloacimonadales bacterium]
MNQRISQTISLRQRQEQSLKPQMIQSLKMLALPMLDLEIALKNEIIQNPLLEMTEEYEENNRDEEMANDNKELDNETQETLDEVKELSEILDEWNEYHEDHEYSSKSYEDDSPSYENYIRVEENLCRLFTDLIDDYPLTDLEKDFAFELVENTNEYGFLPDGYDIYEVGKEYELVQDDVDKVHRMILRTKPRGVTARSIEECLIAQLEEYELKDTILVGIIEEDFNDLIYRRFSIIASKYGITEDDVLDYRDRIAQLDPKPGMRLNTSKASYIVPDVIVRKIGEEYEVIINDFYVPRITLSRNYRSMLHQSAGNKEAVRYIRSKVNSAKFLIKSIFMRSRTLERVMRSIINYQKDFFYNNTGILEPLTYSVIASDLNVNESTISRVVKLKYADTPFGIMCMKDFFCSAAGKDKNYDAVSKQNVQLQIEELIEKEDKRTPLSDQDIVNILKERGISVSRRVIAKYRDELQIPNSRIRRE